MLFQESNTKEKTKKHNRHFIGHHIGGVGGVFPPVLKSSRKEYFDKKVSKFYLKDDNIFENSKHVKSKHENSTCVHDNKIYHAGQTVSTCALSSGFTDLQWTKMNFQFV